MNVKELESSKQLGYKYVRGSTLYNTNIETSDVDYGGVFIAPNEVLLGLSAFYKDQISDEKHDTTYYEFNRWVELLIKANPNALESLYVPEDKVVGTIHPAIQLIIDNRDLFLTKECFKSLSGYAYAQIQKCRGLNKKCVQPIVKRKEVLDFCFVPYGQGATHVTKWLEDNGLKQKYCGLVSLPNMHDVYGLYYDFGTHVICEYNVDLRNKDQVNDLSDRLFYSDDDNDRLFLSSFMKYSDYPSLYNLEPSGYHGIVSETSDSNSVRFESVVKGDKPITIMTFNKSGYEAHCRNYKEYQEWVQKRNPARYESNLKSNYDVKNVAHCVRLLHMGLELARGEGFNVVRTWDREMILDIRNHKYEYEEIIEYVEKIFAEMKELAAKCNLPKSADKVKINNLVLQARKLL